MADRSVSVELRLKAAGYLAGLQAAKQATRDLGKETFKATATNQRNLQTVGRAGLIAGGAIAAGLGVAVVASTKFEKSLSGVQAVADATSGQLGKLRQAALDAGRDTVFSASESADAEAELAKAGVSVGDILGGGLTGALSLAAAGQIDLADAATIAAQAMNIFSLRGADVGHIADVLAAGANKSAADVGQLGEALRQGGLLAAQTGLSLEDTVGALSAFADNALIGSDAGTSLKTMLQRLVPQGEKARSAMESIGFSAYDAQGNFVGLQSVAEQLQKGLGTLSAEQRASTLNTIFGSDAVRAANVLYEEGAAGIDNYTQAVDDQGAASRNAAIQMDNLAGDLEQLKGSIETALIQTGSAGNDSLRGLTQTATGAVNAFSGLPGGAQKAAFGIGTVAAAGLLTVGAIGTLVPKVQQAREALRDLGPAGARADAGLGKAGRAMARTAAAFTAGLIAYEAARKVIGAQGADDFSRLADSIEAGAGDGSQAKIAALTAKIKGLDDESVDGLLNFRAWGYNVALGSTDAYNAAGAADSLRDRLKALKAEQKTAAETAKNSASAQREVADAYANVVSPAVEEATSAIADYEAILNQVSANIDAFTAPAELAQAFRALTKDLTDGGKVTDEEKIKVGGFAAQVAAAADAVFNATGNQRKANAIMRVGRKDFIAAAEAAGYGAKQAKKLADRLGLIPVKTKPDIDNSDINAAIRRTKVLLALLSQVGTSRAVGLGVINKTGAARGRGEFATGGMVYGPGTSRSDSIPALLSNGEFVVNAASTQANRGLLEAINSGNRFADGGVVRNYAAPNSGSNSSGPSYSQSITVLAPDPVAAGESVARRGRNEAWKAGWPVP